MKDCYLTHSGGYLPGSPISNSEIPDFLGDLDGEKEVRTKILRMNGIKKRYYALGRDQKPTMDLYSLAAEAAQSCLDTTGEGVTYLSVGTTHAPLWGPGVASILHGRLAQRGHLKGPVEVNSCGGICSASAQALVNAIRAVESGQHADVLSVGVEQPSEILKSSVIQVPDDRGPDMDISETAWFMSVFLRSMLSDGAGAFRLQDQPVSSGLSLRVNWTFSRSFAHEAPLCMKLDSRTRLLSQDTRTLRRHLKPCVSQVVQEAFSRNDDRLSSYRVVLPHLSSFFFRKIMRDVFRQQAGENAPPFWTNLEHAGNTGAASIYLMLDEFLRSQALENGDRVLLFVPESGQFNFVLISLTACRN